MGRSSQTKQKSGGSTENKKEEKYYNPTSIYGGKQEIFQELEKSGVK